VVARQPALAFLFAPTYSACNLYVVSAGGGRLQAATHFRDFSLDPNTPSWSSDGRRLAATSFPHGDELQTDLRLVDGTRVARLTTTPDAAESDPAYSRTGRLAYSRTNAFVDQVVIRLPSGAEKVVAQGREPTWAPDERRLAYVRDGALYVRAVAGGGERMVVPRELNASDPAWSPRGDLIVFTNHSARGDTLDVVRADGGELRVLGRLLRRRMGWSSRRGRATGNAWRSCSRCSGAACRRATTAPARS